MSCLYGNYRLFNSYVFIMIVTTTGGDCQVLM